MIEAERQSLKIVLLGNSGVGKTSIVNRWVIGDFQRNSKPTIGANHQRKTVEIDEQKVDLYIWDTAGQEQFQSLTPLYTREAVSAVITTAIDDQNSFDNIDTWIELLRSSCADMPPMVLAVNKIDLGGEAVLTNDEIQIRYGKRFSGIFFVSALTGEGVDQTFMHAAESGYRFVHKMRSPPTTLKESTKKKDCQC